MSISIVRIVSGELTQVEKIVYFDESGMRRWGRVRLSTDEYKLANNQGQVHIVTSQLRARRPYSPSRALTGLLAGAMVLGLLMGVTAHTNRAIAATAITSGFVITPSAAFARAPITPSTPRISVGRLKTINYYPSNAPWTTMWTNYNHGIVDADFAKISQLGANSIRLIIQPSAVGYATVSPTGAAEVKDVIDTAAAHGLAIVFTLFDWFGGYSELTYSAQWMTSLLAPYKNDNRIALVGLQNEVVLTNPQAVTWGRAILALLPSLLPGVPRTLSAQGGQDVPMFTLLNADFPPNLLDVIAVHLYGSENSIISKLAAATAAAAGRPVFVGELGATTDQWNSSCSQSAQLTFYQRTAIDMAQAGVSGMAPWTLNDFQPAAMPAVYPPGAPEERFGLRSLSGTWKAAASAVTAMFAASTPAQELANLSASNIAALNFDNGFECDLRAVSDNTGRDSWAVFDIADTTAAGTAAGTGINGTYAGYLRGTGGSSTTKIPSLMHQFPSLSARPVTLTAQTRLVAASGSTRIAIAWYSAAGAYLGQDQSVLANNANTAWQTLTVTGTPRTGATTFQIHLKSLSNDGTAYFDTVTLNN